MTEVCKAYPKDFETLYPLLKELNDKFTKERWEQLFIPHWRSPEDHIGLKLIVNDKIAGFLGLIFSQRTINGNIENICNWSSLIAFKEYRDGVTPRQLIYKAKETEDCIIVGLTPTDKLHKIYMDLGFEDLDNSVRLLCKPGLFSKKHRNNIYIDEQIIPFLNQTDLKIFNDHKKFHCSHLLIKTDSDYIYLIIKKCLYPLNKLKLPKLFFYFNEFINRIFRYSYLSKGLKTGKLHYCSNYDSFLNNLNIKGICVHLQIEGLLIDERFLNNRRIKRSKKGDWIRSVYLSNSSNKITPADIDSLYSEIFLLDL